MAQDFFHRDMELFIDHRFDWARFFRLRGVAGNPEDEVAAYKSILRSAGEVCEDIAALTRGHWHEEVRLVNGEVVVPPHIAAGFEKLRAAGLVCVTLSPEYGGYGLPVLLNGALLEMVAHADAGLMTILGLQSGVAGDIERYGTEELRKLYLPRFATGELQGAMDLTEPQAGSDLGGILTRATREDGRWFVDGAKIFITNGGAPIHLVLARDAATFEQSRGTTSGLSLLLCPRTLPDGTPNRISISRVESKLGIHGSPTCALEFDHAEAFLLGLPGQGFRAMLDLMNHARLGVAAQAIGIAEAAYREARAYAAQREQFGAPIIQQPLVKDLLGRMALHTQGARALLNRTCALIDMTDALRVYLRSERGAADPDRAKLQEELEQNTQLIRFFTPLCKYYATEISNDVARKGVQVHGGLGYMAESRAGQYLSDSIITTIYEGTSEIQASFALKEMSKGALLATLDQVRAELASLEERAPELVEDVTSAIAWINESLPALMGDPQYALLNAKRVCQMVIDVVVAAELLQQASRAEEKRETAETFVRRNMLSVEMYARRIASGDVSRIRRYDRLLGL